MTAKARKNPKTTKLDRLGRAEATINELARYINGYRRDTGMSPEPPRYLPRGLALFADGLGVAMDVPEHGISLHLRTNEDDDMPAYIVDVYCGYVNDENHAPARHLGAVYVSVPWTIARQTGAIGSAVESAIALDRTLQRNLSK